MQQNIKNNILICHWNAGGLKPKVNDLKIFCQQYSPDILLLQETKLKPNDPINISNYAFYHTPQLVSKKGIKRRASPHVNPQNELDFLEEFTRNIIDGYSLLKREINMIKMKTGTADPSKQKITWTKGPKSKIFLEQKQINCSETNIPLKNSFDIFRTEDCDSDATQIAEWVTTNQNTPSKRKRFPNLYETPRKKQPLFGDNDNDNEVLIIDLDNEQENRQENESNSFQKPKRTSKIPPIAIKDDKFNWKNLWEELKQLGVENIPICRQTYDSFNIKPNDEDQFRKITKYLRDNNIAFNSSEKKIKVVIRGIRDFNEKDIEDTLKDLDYDVETLPEKAFCKVCKVQLRAHRSDLTKHAATVKLVRNARTIAVPTQRKLPAIFSQKTATTSFEIKLAAFVACHTSIRSVDHLTELLKSEFPPQSSSSSSSSICLKDIKLHRTKCSAIIKKDIAPALFEEQIEGIKDEMFSLIIDESTDVSCVKHLCLCIRYYHPKDNRIVSQYLGLIHVTVTTAEVLYNTVKSFSGQNKIEIKQCFAIATDGASNLCGVNNSLFTLMKQDNPDLILVKCICHSLHLVCSHASEELPSNIDYLLRETYNWFHRSALRCDSYMELFKLINDGDEPLKILPLSPTRWLARSSSIKRIMHQWDALELHFKMVSSNCDKYYARELSAMYSDPVNKLYLTFLLPVLTEFERVNLLFQKDMADICSILQDLRSFVLSIFRRIACPSAKTAENIPQTITEEDLVSYEDADFGYEFSNLLVENLASGKISPEQARCVKQRCYQFLKRASKELINRIPGNMEILSKIENFSPNICLSHTRPPFSDLPIELLPQKSQIGEIENQWRPLLTTKWEIFFPGGIPTNGIDFWCKVTTIKNAGGDLAFKELSQFALNMYSLPISSATVERVFLRVTSTKTKLRNRMGLELLSSILRVKMMFEDRNICCYDFIPSAKMLKFNSSIYHGESSTEENEEADHLFSVIQF
nr:uncharacterized protein LOC122271550 [Parasteatoda tepidariorum]